MSPLKKRFEINYTITTVKIKQYLEGLNVAMNLITLEEFYDLMLNLVSYAFILQTNHSFICKIMRKTKA